MLNLIIYIICIAIGALMITTGISLLSSWHKRVRQWKTIPSILEFLGCLFDGLVGAVSTIIGTLFSVVIIYSLI